MYVNTSSINKMNSKVKGQDMYLGYILFTENVPKQNNNINEDNISFTSLSIEEKNNWNIMAKKLNKEKVKKYKTKAIRKPNKYFNQLSIYNRWIDDM